MRLLGSLLMLCGFIAVADEATPITFRTPTTNDLTAILDLTRANRALLAALDPEFWGPSADADKVHADFLAGRFESPNSTQRLMERGRDAIGYVVSFRRRDGVYFVDDVCLADGADWSSDGVRLFREISERPAQMTAPHDDHARLEAAHTAGLVFNGSARTIYFDRGEFNFQPSGESIEPLAPPASLVAPAIPRVQVPGMAPDQLTVIGDSPTSYVVISAAVPAPPVYKATNVFSFIDRVVGNNRTELVSRALSFAAARGDAGTVLVIGRDDNELITFADNIGMGHPVDYIA